MQFRHAAQDRSTAQIVDIDIDRASRIRDKMHERGGAGGRFDEDQRQRVSESDDSVSGSETPEIDRPSKLTWKEGGGTQANIRKVRRSGQCQERTFGAYASRQRRAHLGHETFGTKV